jgi:ribosome-associated translation inhibitor RaiA
MELMEEEYQMVADINRHFDETLQIQLNPTLASGEENRFEFDALKKTSERLETQLAKYKAELENTRK